MKSQATNAGRAISLVLAYFIAALLGGWILKRQIFITAALSKMPALMLLILNGILMITGVPLSAVGDLLLLKKIGISYLFYWPFVVAMVSCAQICFFRSRLCRALALPLMQRLQTRSSAIIRGKTRKSLFILLIRAVPLMPFMLGSFVIAMLPGVSARMVIICSLIGCYVYYIYFGAGFMLGSSALGS